MPNSTLIIKQRAEEAAPILKDVDYAEPCVSVMKMREFGGNERFDKWCIKHHHWLNGNPAITVVERMVQS